MLGHIKYRVYYNLGNWYRVLSLLPGYDINAEFMEQMMGVKEKIDIPITTTPSSQNKYYRLVRMIFHLFKQWYLIEKSTTQFYIRFQQALDSVPIESLKNEPPTKLKQAYKLLESKLITQWDTPLVNDFFAMIAFGIVVKILEGLPLDDPKATANRLLANEGGIISTEPSKELQRLAEELKLNEAFATRFLSTESAKECIQLLKSDEHLWTRVTNYLNRFGNRWAEELKLETITPSLQPELLIPMLKIYLQTEISENSNTLIEEKNETEHLVKTQFGFLSPKKWLFNKMLHQARKRIRGRENLRFERTRLFAKIRELFPEWGTYLFKNGLISSPRDIFFLTKTELFRLTDGTLTDVQLKTVISNGKQEWNDVESLQLPERIKSYGNANFFDQIHHVEIPLTEGNISGIGCSKGRVKAKD